jgi:hypothetical protein
VVERSLFYQARDQQAPSVAKSSPMKPTVHESENRRSTWRYSFTSARRADDIHVLACAVDRLAKKGLVDRWQLLETVPTGIRRAATRRDTVRFATTFTLVVAMIAAAGGRRNRPPTPMPHQHSPTTSRVWQ